MFRSNEYSRLRNNSNGEDVIILPNEKFEAFEGNYTVTSYARVLGDDGSQLFLRSGDVIKGIGTVKKKRAKRKVVQNGKD